ncbi:hypothetical protein EH535_20425 [Escherichia coli]|nr:hypothetical protein [Escherichia coli]
MNHGYQRVINVYASAQCTLSTINKEEQKLCKSYNGKTYQKYRLILVFKPFLLVSMIQRLSKKAGKFNNSWKLWTLSRGFNLTAAFLFWLNY